MRYRFFSYKYERKMNPEQAVQSLWEVFGSWTLPSALSSAAHWRPPTDVYETTGDVVVLVEIPGVTEDDLSVTLFSDLLVVEGKRRRPALTAMNACHQLGIKYGEFRTEIPLPRPVDPDNVDAEYTQGFLMITLRKAA